MRKMIGALILVGSMLLPGRAVADDFDLEKEWNPTGYVTILATGRDFAALEKEAKAMARKAKIPYSMNGNAFDPKKGLITLDGNYIFRREDTLEVKGKETPFLSIEKSDGYPGLKKGYYIIVGGVSLSPKDATAARARYLKVVPKTYNARTTIYIGCRC